MMLYYRETSKYTVKCPKCDELFKFSIDLNNLKIVGQCKKGHYFDDILFNKFEYDYIKKTDVYKSKNGELKSGEKQSNYTCHKCKKSFDCTCNENNNNKNDNLCTIHDLEYDYFYNDSKIFLCKDCIKLYQYEGEKEKETYNKIVKYNEKNTKLIEYLEELKKDFEDKQNKLYKYLNLLNKLNSLLLKNFNYTIIDDFNYDNFNYLLNLQKNDEILNEKNFFNYIVYGTFLNNNKLNEINIVNNNTNIIKQEEKIDKKENVINNYNNLKYFKDNIFYTHSDYDTTINLFEYDNFSFKHLYSFEMKENYYNVESLIKSNYDHFFYMYKDHDYLYMLDYSDENKNLYIKHKINLGQYYLFKNLIETQKGQIIIKEKKRFTIWEKQNNAADDDNYKLVSNFDGRFDILYNINDSLFLCVQDNNNESSQTLIYILENEKFKTIKKINVSFTIKSIHKLNYETLVLINYKMNQFYFYDIKNLELVQIMEYQPINNSFLISNNNYLLEFVPNENKDEMRVRTLNVKNACFENYGIMKTKINQDIYLTNNNLIFFTQSNALKIFKL